MTEQQTFAFANDPTIVVPSRTTMPPQRATAPQRTKFARHRDTDWRIDERTRSVGRAGIAQARATLMSFHKKAA